MDKAQKKAWVFSNNRNLSIGSALFLFVGCSNVFKNTKSDDIPNSEDPPQKTTQQQLPRDGQRPSQGFGFEVDVASGIADDPSLTSKNIRSGSFMIKCNEKAEATHILNLELTIKKLDPAETFLETLSFKSHCLGSEKITVTSLVPNETATLKVTIKDLNDKSLFAGTTEEYKETAVPEPTPPPPAPDGAKPGPGQRPKGGFTRSAPKQLSINMVAVPESVQTPEPTANPSVTPTPVP